MPLEQRLLAFILLVVLAQLTACSGKPDKGPKKINWDRDTCARCRMVLSDRKTAAEIRYFPQGKRSKVDVFDDIGCAILWLDARPSLKKDPRTEIWVIDHRTGEWIDARKATYIGGKITPMEYGLWAQSGPADGGLDFAQAERHVREVEARFNLHGVHLRKKLERQVRQGVKDQEPAAGEESPPPVIGTGSVQ